MRSYKTSASRNRYGFLVFTVSTRLAGFTVSRRGLSATRARKKLDRAIEQALGPGPYAFELNGLSGRARAMGIDLEELYDAPSSPPTISDATLYKEE